MKLYLLLLLLLQFCFINHVQSLKIQDTKIQTTRDQNQVNICSYFHTGFTLKQRQNSKQAVKKYNVLSNQEIQERLKSGNYNNPNSSTILITIPHVIALAILLSLMPALFCCCTWPQKYPQCKKFRKPKDYLYSKYQLKVPAYLSVVFFLIVIVGSLLALIQAPQIVNHVNNVGCKNATIYDDILNGKISQSDSSTFFVGLNSLKAQLQTFVASKIATFFSEGSNSLSTANLVRTYQQSIESSIQSVYTNYINLSYLNAFSADGISYNTVISAFKQLFLGPSSDSTKILGNIKTKLTVIFNEINLALDQMIVSWGILQGKTQAVVTTEINNFNTAITTLNNNLKIYLNDVGKNYYKPQLYNMLSNILKAFYGMVFFFSLIGFIASVWISLCKVAKCRFFMYFTCGFLNFLAVFGFCFLTYLAFYHPQYAQTCAYIDQKLSTGNGTKQLFNKMGLNNFGNLMINCMNNDENGKITQTINPNFSNSFDQINLISHGTLQFNDKISSYTTTNIDTPFIQAQTVIDAVNDAKKWDITDQTAKDHVTKIVQKTYTIDVDCDNLNVLSDVWMPSFDLYACPAGKAKMAPCSNLGDKTICPLGCYEILNTIISPSGDPLYVSTLQTRYSTNTCNYYEYITSLHQNWNIPRRNKMASVKSSINNLKTVVNVYTTKVNSVKASLNSFKTTLETNLNSMTNLNSGSFNGMDCKIISQSVWTFRDSICIGLQQSMLYNIICLCLICYSVLLLSCFVTCAGVRHFEFDKKKPINDGTVQDINKIQYSNAIGIRDNDEFD